MAKRIQEIIIILHSYIRLISTENCHVREIIEKSQPNDKNKSNCCKNYAKKFLPRIENLYHSI